MQLGRAALQSEDYPSGPPDGLGELNGWRFQHVSIGNPQCAIRVQDTATLATLDLGALGPPIEAHASFPNRTNVSWFAELEPGPPARIRARIFERGVGETLASGTGASGAAVAYVLGEGERLVGSGGGPAHVSVVLDGGELEVELDSELGVCLSGWALPVFAGSLSEELLLALQDAA
jgi:diaminopimelate epimerase